MLSTELHYIDWATRSPHISPHSILQINIFFFADVTWQSRATSKTDFINWIVKNKARGQRCPDFGLWIFGQTPKILYYLPHNATQPIASFFGPCLVNAHIFQISLHYNTTLHFISRYHTNTSVLYWTKAVAVSETLSSVQSGPIRLFFMFVVSSMRVWTGYCLQTSIAPQFIYSQPASPLDSFWTPVVIGGVSNNVRLRLSIGALLCLRLWDSGSSPDWRLPITILICLERH